MDNSNIQNDRQKYLHSVSSLKTNSNLKLNFENPIIEHVKDLQIECTEQVIDFKNSNHSPFNDYRSDFMNKKNNRNIESSINTPYVRNANQINTLYIQKSVLDSTNETPKPVRST